MNDIELREKIAKGEGFHSEFKETLPNKENLAKVIVCFANTNGGQIFIGVKDSGEIAGIENAQRFLRLYLREEHSIKGFEPEIEFEIPDVVLREAVVNAIAHRDYTIEGPIRIIVYENRVEVRTPGKLSNSVTIESIKIGGSHVLRNPTIYNLLYKMGMVTDLGSGVRRMIQLMKKHSNKDIILEEIENGFVLSIPRKAQL